MFVLLVLLLPDGSHPHMMDPPTTPSAQSIAHLGKALVARGGGEGVALGEVGLLRRQVVAPEGFGALEQDVHGLGHLVQLRPKRPLDRLRGSLLRRVGGVLGPVDRRGQALKVESRPLPPSQLRLLLARPYARQGRCSSCWRQLPPDRGPGGSRRVLVEGHWVVFSVASGCFSFSW